MKLNVFDITRLSLAQNEKVTTDELKMIEKKSGKKAMKICFPIFSAILLIAIIQSIVFEKEFPLFYILVFVFLGLPMSIGLFKEKKICACCGVVTNKIVRCAEVHGRGSLYVPFEKTEAEGTYKHKYTLFRTISDFYFCTVEINGEVYENVCCCEKDYSRINIGDRVIIALEDSYNIPVIYLSKTR